MSHISWDEYFMGVALLSSYRSKDPHTKVGACIVNTKKRIVGIGYNGFPYGCDDEIYPWANSKQNKFLDTKIYVGANIYEEYEFMYEEDNTLTHGIIDLLLEFDDKCIIIDYKLKNVDDDAYIKQLNGYKKYIESITNKNTETYLYSIIDGILIKK